MNTVEQSFALIAKFEGCRLKAYQDIVGVWTIGFGETLGRPRAILVASAHWTTAAPAVCAVAQPETIHDFGGFPQALFEIQYPAPGSPALANRVKELLNVPVVLEENEWGIDHGAWSVLKYIYPRADVPIVQLSLDGSMSARAHYELAKQLRPLRNENILILSKYVKSVQGC